MSAAITLGTRPLSPVIIAELRYACDLLRRAQKAIDQEFAVLRAAGVQIEAAADWVTMDLQNMAVQCHLLAVGVHQSIATCPGRAA